MSCNPGWPAALEAGVVASLFVTVDLWSAATVAVSVPNLALRVRPLTEDDIILSTFQAVGHVSVQWDYTQGGLVKTTGAPRKGGI